MADTLLASETDASQTSEPDELADVTPETKDETPVDGAQPDEGGDESQVEKGSEEGQEESGDTAPENEEVSYDALELGEDSPFDDGYVDSVKEFAAANGLTQEAAQAVISRDETRAAAADKVWADMVNPGGTWETEIRNDPDYGGANLDQTVANARAAMSKFAPEGFQQALNETGYGNNPALLRFVANVGAAMSEAQKMVKGGKSDPDTGPTWQTLFTESGDPPIARGA